MISLKLVDRIAIAAMFTVSVAVPLATLTPLAAMPSAGMSVASSNVAFRVFASRRALGDEDFRQIRPGMNASDVLALIGPPYARMRFEATKTTAWDYHYMDAWNYDSDFSVVLDDAGVVVSKVSVRNGQ